VPLRPRLPLKPGIEEEAAEDTGAVALPEIDRLLPDAGVNQPRSLVNQRRNSAKDFKTPRLRLRKTASKLSRKQRARARPAWAI